MGCACAQHRPVLGEDLMAAHERSVGLHRGAAWSCAWAKHGAAHACSVLLRMRAAWGCIGAQHGAAHRRSMGLGMGLRRGAAWACA